MKVIRFINELIKLKNVKTSYVYTNRNSIIFISLLIIFYFLPNELIYNSRSFCIHNYLLGFDCPGCGMTRALFSLFHLNLADSLNYNFAVIPLFLILLLEIFNIFNRFKQFDYIKKYFNFISFIFVKYILSIFHLFFNFN
jgi:hypothetical protein